MNSDVLFLPFVITSPHWTAGFVSQIAALSLTAGVLSYVLARRFHVFMRPAFLLSAACLCLFQLPLLLFYNQLAEGLQASFIYAASVAAFSGFLSVYVLVTELLIWKNCRETRVADNATRSSWRQLVVIAGALVASTGVYLAFLPIACSALYAMLADPEMSLVAREVSLKLLPSPIPAYAYGAIAQVIAPAIGAFSVWFVLARKFTIASFVSLGALLLLVLLAILIPGIKGNLLPLIAGFAVAAVAYPGGILWRGAAVGAAFIITIGLVSGFEQLRERSGIVSLPQYDLAACAVKLEACNLARDLTRSMELRDYSLLVAPGRVSILVDNVDRVCSSEIPSPSESLQSLPQRPTDIPQSLPQRPTDIPPLEDTRAADAKFDQRSGSDAIRGVLIYANAVMYRAFVVPMQTGAWYYLHAEEEGAPGASAIPVIGRLLGDFVNMPRIIHDQYYPRYSSGAAISTGTVPLAYFIAYPVYLGVIGLALAIAIAIGVDALMSILLRLLKGPAYFAGGSISAVVSLNLVLSDFSTVLLTHGLLAAITLLALFAFIERGGVGRQPSLSKVGLTQS